MNKMECKYCNKVLSTSGSLKKHQKETQYCLEMQGKLEKTHICSMCTKGFTSKTSYNTHVKICKNKSENNLLREKIIALESENKMLKDQLEKSQEHCKELSLTAIKKSSTTNTKSVQINNYIQKMEPLIIDDVQKSVSMLTLAHHVRGAEGYADFALEIPFKDKIVCVDVTRNKFKYKNENGDVIVDDGFTNMFRKLCQTMKARSWDLSQEHYEDLAKEFTEKEIKSVDLNKAALSIARYSMGKDDPFCKEIIKNISKGAKIKN